MAGGKKDEPKGVRVGWGLVAAAILIFLTPVAGGLLYQAGYDQAAADRTREYAEHANDQVGNACRDAPTAQKVICFANARIEGDLKKHDSERNEADLVAQRKTALWTMLMGMAAFVGMALSLIGVILVFRTFGATREANEIARDTAKRELRAYIHLKNSDLLKCKSANFAGKCEHPEQRVARLEFQNYGQTPAHNVISVFGVKIDRVPLTEPLGEIPDWVERSVSDLAPGRENPMFLEVAASGFRHDDLLKGGWGVYYWGVITYEDIFGDRHTTQISLVSEGAGYKRGAFRMTVEGNSAD